VNGGRETSGARAAGASDCFSAPGRDWETWCRFLGRERREPVESDPARPLSLAAESERSGGRLRSWGQTEQGWEVEFADPLAIDLEDDLRFLLGPDIRVFVAETPASPRATPAGPDTESFDQAADEGPVIGWVDATLERAVRERASDLHVEWIAGSLQVRMRVDGQMRSLDGPPARLAPRVIARLKVLANLDLAERRLPQDGRIRRRRGGREMDLRVSTLPTAGGESVVIRVLDTGALRRDLSELGLPDGILDGLRQTLALPHGLGLVTGPTGAGKTTTLYAAVQEKLSGSRKVISVEDPVEFQVDGMMQVPVNPTAGLSFGTALRSVLRQDPDVIMIGEIRDPETALIAVQAALTGHLVLSSLHTGDCVSAVSRLVNLGVPRYLVASALVGVVAQRLVRASCRCRRTRAGSDGSPVSDCPICAGTGYHGRRTLFEWLPTTAAWRDQIGRDQSPAELRGWLAARGFRSLAQQAAEMVTSRETTREEASRWVDDLPGS